MTVPKNAGSPGNDKISVTSFMGIHRRLQYAALCAIFKIILQGISKWRESPSNAVWCIRLRGILHVGSAAVAVASRSWYV